MPGSWAMNATLALPDSYGAGVLDCFARVFDSEPKFGISSVSTGWVPGRVNYGLTLVSHELVGAERSVVEPASKLL